MWLKTLQQAKRLIKIVVGFTVLLAGVIMLITPGPGWVAIFAGLAILAAAEIVWAKRLLDHLKERGGKIRDAVFRPDGTKKVTEPPQVPNPPIESPK